MRFLLTILLLAVSGLGLIQTSGLIVEGVQSPAWVERAGKREPLSVGMRLADQDRVISGREARVLLRMAEDSLVKLGADGRLDLDRLSLRDDPQNSLVTAALDVVKGAFRHLPSFDEANALAERLRAFPGVTNPSAVRG